MRHLVLCLLLASLSIAQAQTDTNSASASDAATSAVHQVAPYVSSSAAPVPVNGTVQGGPQQQEEIADIRPPFFFLHSWFWLWAILGAIVLIALLILLWRLLKRQPFLSPKSAYELTLEKLEKARALINEEDPKPYAVLVSETIRTYLGQRFQTPSTRRTTEEFLRLMEKDEATPLAEHRELLRNFLQSCDLVKFARYQPTLAELEDVQQRAMNFVIATKPVATAGNTTGARP